MANYQAGFNAKGRINGGVYTLQTYRCRDTASDQDVSNTEGVPGNPAVPGGAGGTIAPDAESRITGLQHLEAEVKNATFDTLANPFTTPGGANTVLITPSVINVSQFISLRIFPPGTTGVSWFSPSFLVLEASQEGDIRAIQPVTFSGKSDGWYQTPYQ